MADNVTINPGAGGAVVSTDDIAGVQVQRVKVQHGADGVATDVSTASPLPVSDAGGSITVDGAVAVAGPDAHDAAVAGNPVVGGGVASAAAPAAVSADGDAVRSWHLRNGAQMVGVQAAGALIGGDATNGLDVDVTRVTGTVTIAGVAAHDAAVSGNPVLVGLASSTAAPTAVTADGEVVRAWANRRGAQATFSTFADGTVATGDVTNGIDVDVTRVSGNVAVTQSGTWTVQPGNTANTTPWIFQISDGTNAAAIKAATTPAVAADKALVVAKSPNDNPTTTTLTNVAGTASSTQLLAAAATRKGVTIWNDSAAILYVKLGTTASTTSCTVKLLADAYYEVPFGYTGRIDGIWASATGNARITELT